jgi:hypothetical protein
MSMISHVPVISVPSIQRRLPEDPGDFIGYVHAMVEDEARYHRIDIAASRVERRVLELLDLAEAQYDLELPSKTFWGVRVTAQSEDNVINASIRVWVVDKAGGAQIIDSDDGYTAFLILKPDVRVTEPSVFEALISLGKLVWRTTKDRHGKQEDQDR